MNNICPADRFLSCNQSNLSDRICRTTNQNEGLRIIDKYVPENFFDISIKIDRNKCKVRIDIPGQFIHQN